MPRNRRDANLSVSKALPAGAATNFSSGIDLELTSRADWLGGAEVLVEVPALTTVQLPDTKTVTYSLQHDTDPAFGTAVDVYNGFTMVQTGAGGAGAAAISKRIGLPSDVKRYLRLKQVSVATADGSAVSSTTSLVF